MRALFLSSAVSLIASTTAFAAETHPPARLVTNIPTEELSTALKTFAKERELQVLYRTSLVAGRRTEGAAGDLTANETLNRLLRGTGLAFRYVDQRTVTLAPLAPPGSSTEGAGDGHKQAERSPAGGKEKARRSFSGSFRMAESNDAQPQDATAVTPDAHTPAAYRAPLQLEEIVISAEKRKEPLIDTPVSVSVLSAGSLEKLGAVQLSDFASSVPGLTMTTDGAGFSQVTLRGVTTGNIPISPTVAVYIDDVPIGSSSAFGFGGRLGMDLGLFDVARIEVLRGPQGTLYGASTMGGLVKYVTNEPSVEKSSGRVQLGTAEIQDGGMSYIASGTVNIPLVMDKVALRATGYESHDGGYVDNVGVARKDVNRSDIYGGRVELMLVPTDSLTVRLAGLLQDISRDGQATVDYTFSGTPAYGTLDQSRSLAEPFHQQFRLVSANLAYSPGPVSVTAVSSYQTLDTEQIYDYTRVFAPLLSSIGLHYGAVGLPDEPHTDKFTQELRVSSPSAGLVQWLVGGFYTHEVSGDRESFVLRDLSGQPVPNNLFVYSEPSLYEERAVFGDLTVRPTATLEITGGVRYASDQQRFSQYSSGLFGNVSESAGSDEHNFTYLANALYHVRPRQTAYLRYATGYRPGGPNFVAFDPNTGMPLAPPSFRQDALKSYEAGYKAETKGGRFSMDADVYYIRWDDIQLATSRGGFAVFLNARSGATVRGAELSIAARPLAGLSLDGAFAYQNPRMSGADADLGAAKGERLPNVPHFTGAVDADYVLGTFALLPTVGAAVRYIGERTASFDGSLSFPQYRLPSYTTLNVHAGITIASVDLRLYCDNLLDSHGQLSADTDRGPLAQVALIRPRTIGLDATARF